MVGSFSFVMEKQHPKSTKASAKAKAEQVAENEKGEKAGFSPPPKTATDEN